MSIFTWLFGRSAPQEAGQPARPPGGESLERTLEDLGFVVIDPRSDEDRARDAGVRELASRPMDPEVAGMLSDLLIIGRFDGFLGKGRGRTRAIGKELDRRGGMELMLMMHQKVEIGLGGSHARMLESAWDGIGEWEG